MDEDAYKEHLQEHRKEKDRFFKEHPQSPVPADERQGFDGLAYYPVDPAYAKHATLEAAEPEKLTIPQTTGGEVTYERVGTFTVELPEGTVTLAAFETPNSREGELFVPFKDATAPEETYGAGRYVEAHHAHDDHYHLDFNTAYHPFCAYNDQYACALPPPENQVEVPIRAGERLPEPG